MKESASSKTLVTMQVGPLAYGGAFVARVVSTDANQNGKKAFVREVIPSEEVLAQLTKEEKTFLRAKAIKIIKASPFRVKPTCPKFGICGGCDLQHMTISAQRQAKREMVESMLKHQAGVVAAKGVSTIGDDLLALHYRRRITLHLDRSGQLGFFEPESNSVVDINTCDLAEERINEMLKTVRGILCVADNAFDTVVIERANDEIFVRINTRDVSTQLSHASSEKVLEALRLNVPNLMIYSRGAYQHVQYHFQVGQAFPTNSIGNSFTQVNEKANKILQETVAQYVDAEEVTDLYAGAGNLSLLLARTGKKVDAVENDFELVQYGIRLAKEAHVSNRLYFYQLSCEEFVATKKLKHTVVLDPPRAGAKGVVQKLAPADVKRIVYVSCNLPTLTRDIKVLASKGFVLDQVLTLDMFPQTHHVEIIAVLERS